MPMRPAGTKLDAYVRWVQRVAERYEAIFDHLTMGDKGSCICLAFRCAHRPQR